MRNYNIGEPRENDANKWKVKLAHLEIFSKFVLTSENQNKKIIKFYFMTKI